MKGTEGNVAGAAAAEPPQLPLDPAACHRIIRHQEALLRQVRETLSATERLNRQLLNRLTEVLRGRYGPAATRFDATQLLLFARQAAAEPPPESADAEPSPDKPEGAFAGRHNGHGRSHPPADLPRLRVEHSVDPKDVPCPACGKDRARIGEEVSEQLEYFPAKLFVFEHVRPKLACRACGGHVVLAEKPAQPIEKGLPGPGLVAYIVTAKYDDHLPLHRLEHILQRHGAEISRSTMCGWMAAAARLLEPVVNRMTERVRQSRIIHTDDTTVPVRDPKLDKTRSGRLWVYIGDRDHPYTVYDYTPTHARDGPAQWLSGYKGYLQADAFGGYDGIYAGGEIVEVACWAHVRRKFHDAREADPPAADAVLADIRRLYDVEDAGKKLDPEARGALRREKSLPVLEELFARLQQLSITTLPRSPQGIAVAYALKNRVALCRYCEDGDLAADNNASERALRRIAVGRGNWLFAGSDNGGRTAAVLYSAIASARRHGLDPQAYLCGVLAQIPVLPYSRLDELLPDRWKAALERERRESPSGAQSGDGTAANSAPA